MAKPTKPKDLKPKADGEGEASSAKGGGGLDIKFIITILAVVICSIGGSVGAVYFIAPMVLVPAITAHLPKGEGAPAEEAAGGEEKKESSVGMTLELDEFTVNLKSDPNVGGNQFVRAKIALSIGVPPAEECDHPKAQLAPGALGTPRAIAVVSQPSHQCAPEKTDVLAQSQPVNFLSSGTLAGAAIPVADRTLLAEGGEGGGGEEACLKAFQAKMGKYVPSIRDVVNSSLMKRTAAEIATIEGQESLKDDIKGQVSQLLGEEYKVLRVNFQDFIIQH